MKDVNAYYTSFNNTNNKKDYLKYGLMNEFGSNLEQSNRKKYKEEDIIKTNCNHKRK